MTRRTVALSLAIAMVWVTPVLGGPSHEAAPPAVARDLVVRDWTPAAAPSGRTAASATTTDTWMVF